MHILSNWVERKPFRRAAHRTTAGATPSAPPAWKPQGTLCGGAGGVLWIGLGWVSLWAPKRRPPTEAEAD